MEQFLKTGIISSTHALKGEVKVYPTTDNIRRFDSLCHIFVEQQGEKTLYDIEKVRYFKKMVILKFKGIDRVEEASPLVGAALYVPRTEAVPLGENEYYIADLIGMEVLSAEGELYGIVGDVIQTGANDVYQIESKKYGEFLIPAIKQCIIEIDPEKNRMTVDLLPGLLPERAP